MNSAGPIARSKPVTSVFAAKCSALLRAMFDERTFLFAYSTALCDGQYVHDFAHPAVYRYTINSLAGIQRAQMYQSLGWEMAPIIDGFLALHGSRVANPADNGLLLYLLAVEGHPEAESRLARAERIVTDPLAARRLNLQDLSWLLVGLTKVAELTGETRATAAAKQCWNVLYQRFCNSSTRLPFYNLGRYRRGFTSFGGIAYFLWSAFEFARVFNDVRAWTAFQAGVRQVINLQGVRGEWPWFINANNGGVLDWYQLYSVHQDSMSMLFLLPARDAGLPGVEEAIEKSCSWLFGNNELGAVMIVDSPFFIYRSIRRRERFERGRRYLRALGLEIFGWHQNPQAPSRLEINRECRSYHIGWLLFAWAGRNAHNGLPALFDSFPAA
jgi:hypothetical protein